MPDGAAFINYLMIWRCLRHIPAPALVDLVRPALLLVILQAPAAIFGQSSGSAIPAETPRTPLSSNAPARNAIRPLTPMEPESGACFDRQPQVTVSVPAPAPAPWTLRDRITWASNLVLAVCGYGGIMLALSTLKKMERQTRSTEALASAAADQSRTALLNIQAILDAERPWVLISVEIGLNKANSFNIVATNRGRLPARLVAVAERTTIAMDEAHLAGVPEFPRKAAELPFIPAILLPGESTTIASICRDDLRKICGSAEQRRRVENWEDKIYLYGRILYKDLIARPEERRYETRWCCWYIHGRRKSGLVIAGRPEYNTHT